MSNNAYNQPVQSSSKAKRHALAAEEGTPFPVSTVESTQALYNIGHQMTARSQWQAAAVSFERALAHIPNYLGAQMWFQQYLLNGETPANYSPDFVAELYAQLAHCRYQMGYFEDSRQLAAAALRIAPSCPTALQMKILSDQGSKPLSTCSAAPALGPSHVGPYGSYADQLSIVIFSNLTEKLNKYSELAPPTTGLVKATYGSAIQQFGDWITDCKKWICYDAPAEKCQIGDRYEMALAEFAQAYRFHFKKFEYAGLQNIVHQIITYVDTPYLLFLEHDWLFTPSEVDLAAIIDLFNKYPQINSIRFNKRTNIISNFDFLLSKERLDDNISLLKTTGHSNNPHILRIATFRDQWLPVCLNDLTWEKRKMRGTSFGIEQPLFKRYMMDIRQSGFDQAHALWGTYIYGDYNAPAQIAHLGE